MQELKAVNCYYNGIAPDPFDLREWESQKELVWREEYDEQGRVVSRTIYQDDEPVETTLHRYDDRGNLVEEIMTRRGEFDDEEHAEIRRVRYDDRGRILEQTAEFSFGDSEVRRHIYDDRDRTERVEVFNEAGDLVAEEFRQFNERGDVLEESEIHHELEAMARTVFEYDGRGNVVVVISYDSKGELDSRTEYMYDDQGREIASVRTYRWGMTRETTETGYAVEHGTQVVHTRYSNGHEEITRSSSSPDKRYALIEKCNGDGELYSRDEQWSDEEGRTVRQYTVFGVAAGTLQQGHSCQRYVYEYR